MAINNIAIRSPVGEQKQSVTFAPCFAPRLFRGVFRLDDYRRRHARVQRAEIFVGARLSEGEGEAIVSRSPQQTATTR